MTESPESDSPDSQTNMRNVFQYSFVQRVRTTTSEEKDSDDKIWDFRGPNSFVMDETLPTPQVSQSTQFIPHNKNAQTSRNIQVAIPPTPQMSQNDLNGKYEMEVEKVQEIRRPKLRINIPKRLDLNSTGTPMLARSEVKGEKKVTKVVFDMIEETIEFPRLYADEAERPVEKEHEKVGEEEEEEDENRYVTVEEEDDGPIVLDFNASRSNNARKKKKRKKIVEEVNQYFSSFRDEDEDDDEEELVIDSPSQPTLQQSREIQQQRNDEETTSEERDDDDELSTDLDDDEEEDVIEDDDDDDENNDQIIGQKRIREEGDEESVLRIEDLLQNSGNVSKRRKLGSPIFSINGFTCDKMTITNGSSQAVLENVVVKGKFQFE